MFLLFSSTLTEATSLNFIPSLQGQKDGNDYLMSIATEPRI